MPSPPPAYAFLRMPTVATLNPLWDAHDEFADPRHERELAEGRETLSTSAIHAEPEAITHGEKDTTLPLALTATLLALLAQSLRLAGAFTTFATVVAALWMWPRHAETAEHPDTHEQRRKVEQAR